MAERAILLVDDNRDDEALTLRALNATNFDNPVVVAHSGVQALDYLFATGAHAGRDVRDLPAVMLLDLKLPKVDGLQVLQRVRADTRTALMPVVVLTSSKEDQDVLSAYRLGCNSYVRKPVNFDEFVQAMRQLSLYWLRLNERPPTKK